MVKYCTICGNTIYGRARKYCPKCKRSEHIEQMAKYYRDHQTRWMMNGLYFDKQKHNKFGTGSLGGHRLKDYDEELKKIETEFQNLGLRNKKEHWKYKP